MEQTGLCWILPLTALVSPHSLLFHSEGFFQYDFLNQIKMLHVVLLVNSHLSKISLGVICLEGKGQLQLHNRHDRQFSLMIKVTRKKIHLFTC